jgi:hypothetical protein
LAVSPVLIIAGAVFAVDIGRARKGAWRFDASSDVGGGGIICSCLAKQSAWVGLSEHPNAAGTCEGRFEEP